MSCLYCEHSIYCPTCCGVGVCSKKASYQSVCRQQNGCSCRAVPTSAPLTHNDHHHSTTIMLLVLPVVCAAVDNVASKEAIVPLLLARCNSLLVQLSEFKTPPLLDTLASTAPGKARLHLYVATACIMARRFLTPAAFPEDDGDPAVAAAIKNQLPSKPVLVLVTGQSSRACFSQMLCLLAADVDVPLKGLLADVGRLQ